jgi:hypothetical protein
LASTCRSGRASGSIFIRIGCPRERWSSYEAGAARRRREEVESS